MRSSYSFRPGNADDFQFIRDLHRDTMKEYVSAIWGWDESVQEALLRERFNPAKLQVVQSEGRDIGVIQLEKHSGQWFLANLQLMPNYQGQGLGSQILNDILTQADQEATEVALTVLTTNPARMLYERLGFVVTSHDATRLYMTRKPASEPAAHDENQTEIRVYEASSTEELREVKRFYKSEGNGGHAEKGAILFSAYKKDTLIGVVRLVRESGETVLRGMLVQTSLRRQKVGHRLLRSFDSYLVEHKIGPVYCLPYAHLEPFYGSIGFRKISDSELPDFLQKRVSEYRRKFTDKVFVGMKRS